jgi:uncharacterized protein
MKLKVMFPEFKLLSLEDKYIIEEYLNNFPPYSDFCFSSLWSYNTEKEIAYSWLNGNLVIKFSDYTTSKQFYSFIGDSDIKDTFDTLTTFAKQTGIAATFSLIPEINFQRTSIDKLSLDYFIYEDPDNFDYILSVEEISSLRGHALHQKRKLVNTFTKQYSSNSRLEDITDISVQKSILNFLNKWMLQKNLDEVNNNEVTAINRLLNSAGHFELYLLCTYISNQLVGFSIYEKIKKYALCSFQKADYNYRGVTENLNYLIANHLKEINCEYMNIEQDLGIPGLKRSKLDYNPSFLKKYIVFQRFS